jgi:Phosphatidate cytidylyltransferase, mitochondrial
MEAEAIKKILSALQRRWGSLLNQQVVNIIAYGSGAFPQTKDKKTVASNTLDLLVEVRNPSIFHN